MSRRRTRSSTRSIGSFPVPESGPEFGLDDSTLRMFEAVRDALANDSVDPFDRDAFFEAAYEHFAEAGVWELYPEVRDVLEALSPDYELAVISNFDGRLRTILKHLMISKYFRHVFLSSELGADKPDPLIYQRALQISGFAPNEALHVGDDPERDWAGASAADLDVFRLRRPQNSLGDLLALLRKDTNRRKT